MSVAAALVLRPGDGARLRELTRSSTAPAGHVQRARMVLLAAEGLPNTEIGRRVGMTRQTVIAWRAGDEGRGGGGLGELPPFRRPAGGEQPAPGAPPAETPPTG